MAVQKAIILFGIVLLSCTVQGTIQVLDSGRQLKQLQTQVSSTVIHPEAVAGQVGPQPIAKPAIVKTPPIRTGPVNLAPVLAAFDVTAFGAKANGKTDSFEAFSKAWREVCKESAGPSKMVIPKGKFMLGQVVFAGPCKGQVTIEVLGHVVADSDPQNFPSPEWILFQDVTGLVITGPGTFDGQGAPLWPATNCDLANPTECGPAPTSLKFDRVNNVVVNGIVSLNPKQFHFALSECNNFEASGIKLTAGREGLNTVGFSVTSSKQVKISNTAIATGGNCFKIAPDSVVSQVNVQCVFKH